MTSWVYIFSRFTHEALFFEILAILFLFTSYAAFFVLKKRRIGSVRETLPVGVVKDYLNILIQDAQSLRTQLFGLLGAQGGDVTVVARPMVTATATPGAPADSLKFKELETKLANQVKAVEKITKEKEALEKNLENAQKEKGDASGGDPAVTAALETKVKELQSKLDEYSIIEDDLANLKQLQQENAKLKEQLGGKASEAEPAPVEAAPAEDAPLEEAAEGTEEEAPQEVEAKEGDKFEELVDKVEESLEPEVAAPAEDAPLEEVAEGTENAPVEKAPLKAAPVEKAAAGAEVAPAIEKTKPAPQTAAAPEEEIDSGGKSDEDLLAEFEKMLVS